MRVSHAGALFLYASYTYTIMTYPMLLHVAELSMVIDQAAQKRLAKERVKRDQEKKLAKMLGFKGRGRGRSRGGGAR